MSCQNQRKTKPGILFPALAAMRKHVAYTMRFFCRPITRTTIFSCYLVMLTLLISPAGAREWRGTFSIAACDSITGELGVAVQSCVFGVGPRVAWVQAGAGAIATQAASNETFGPRGLQLLSDGFTAQEALDWLLASDDGRDTRQVGIVDADGGVANWTGSECQVWAGDSAGISFTCQGNILVDQETVKAMVEAFRRTSDDELASRLIAALEAGQGAGGDSRGQQSAAVLVGRMHPDYPEYMTRYVDIRVDDHADPIDELRRLYRIYESVGLLQAHMRFVEHFNATADTAGARREKNLVGRTLVKVLTMPDASAEMLNSLAWFTATNDIYLPEALQAAMRATSISPEDSNILDTLAEVNFRVGNRDRAITVIKRAIALTPDSEYLQEQLARFEAGKR